jgi:hypothetical protein
VGLLGHRRFVRILDINALTGLITKKKSTVATSRNVISALMKLP